MVPPGRAVGQRERVELTLRPHVKALFRPVLALMLIGAITGYLLGMITGTGQAGLRAMVLVVAAAAAAYTVVRPFLNWFTTTITLTPQRLTHRVGLWRRTGQELPTSRIIEVTLSQGVLDRVLGSGRLVISTAGDAHPVVLDDIPWAERVQRSLYELAEPRSALRPGRRSAAARGRDLNDDDRDDDEFDDDEYDDEFDDELDDDAVDSFDALLADGDDDDRDEADFDEAEEYEVEDYDFDEYDDEADHTYEMDDADDMAEMTTRRRLALGRWRKHR